MRLALLSFCSAPLLFAGFFASTRAFALPLRSPSEDVYAGEASVIEHYDTVYRMRSDGTGESIVHVVIRVQTEGAARSFSVLSVSFAASSSSGTVENVQVRKPDGTVVATPSTDSIEMPAPVTREAPLYSDLKERQLPVKSIAAGDTLSYDLHTLYQKAEAPDQFWGAEHFTSTGAVVLSQTLTIEVPKEKWLQVWSPKHPSEVSERDGKKIYRWKSSQLRPTSAKTSDGKPDPLKDSDQDEQGRILPSVAWTTFHSWPEVGDWYRSLADERAQPTEALRARADALTKDAKTPEEQVRALYRFVSENTRYVGIDLGVGRYKPHAASETLANQYGDCKDKDTLLEALLRSKGFHTAPALIGVGITPVPELPSPALFNHVITTVELPSGSAAGPVRIWLDSTPGFAPYRVLVPQIRDQQALVVPPDSPAGLETTPENPPFAYREQFHADAILDDKGVLTGHMAYEAKSDTELAIRMMQHSVAPAQWDQAIQYLSNALGFSGTVSNANLHGSEPDAPARLAWDYRRADYADWPNRRILPLFPVLEVTTIDKEKAPEYDIDQGMPRTLVAATSIKLPDGYRAELPSATHVSRAYATFDQTYRLSGGELTVERKAVILKRKIPKADWKDYIAYTKAIGMESSEYIQLIAPEKKTEVSAAHPAAKESKTVTTAPSSAPTSQDVINAEMNVDALMQLADQQQKQNDVEGERNTLLQVKAKDPQRAYLMSMMGYVASRQGKLDEAITDVKEELAHHPDDASNIPLLLSGFYTQQKRYGDAVALLKPYETRNDVWISRNLAWAQQQKGDIADAVATLARAAAAHDDDRPLLSQYASTLHAAHRELEAAAAAKAAMDGTDDPGILNDNSYLLALMHTDLPLAETNVRKSIASREAETANIAVAEANSAAFNGTLNLVAAYDTLAYILMLEHKPAEAEPYQQAAWFNRPDITVGNHLALIDEALGKNDDALTINEIALATDNASANVEDYAEVKRNIERLRKAGAHSSAPDAAQALQTMRTFKVHRPHEVKGWGTFRVQLSADGIADSDLASGSASVKSMTAELNKLQFKGSVPAHSKAKVLRDGVLSCSSAGETCEFVLMPHSGLAAEGVQ